MEAERRKVPRIKVKCAAEVRAKAGDANEVLLTYAVELSRGGCFIRSNRHMAPGTPVELHMKLDGPGTGLYAQGIVLYDGPASNASAEPGSYGFAVGFTVLDKSAERVLSDFLKRPR